MIPCFRLIRPLVVLAAAAPLAGCLGLGGKAPPVLYTLSAAQPATAGATTRGNIRSAIIVTEPESDRRLGVNRVPVQIDAASVAYLKDAMWVERPTRLFRGLLAETIRGRTDALVIQDDEAVAATGIRLGGRLLEMGYDARQQAVVVRFDASRSVGDTQAVTRRFESVIAGVPAKADAVGPALNRAANTVAGEVADWLLAK